MMMTQTATQHRIGKEAALAKHFSVLVVCTENHCRSPVAEAVLRSLAEREGMQRQIRVRSAGTALRRQGQKADLRMRWLGWRRGVRLTSRSRQVGRHQLERFDLVIAMGLSNLRDLHQIHPNATAEIRLFSEFVEGHCPESIPDPVNGSLEEYAATWNLIENGCDGIFRYSCRQLRWTRRDDTSSGRVGMPWTSLGEQWNVPMPAAK